MRSNVVVFVMAAMTLVPLGLFGQTSEALTNADVVTMVKAGLPATVIKAKIKLTPTAFNTSATELGKLKASGVPDEVILEMVMAPAAAAPVATAPTAAPAGNASAFDAPPPAITPASAPTTSAFQLADGTAVKLKLMTDLSAAKTAEDLEVSLAAVEAVAVNGVTVIAKGAKARGKVSVSKGHLGRAGKMGIALVSVDLADGEVAKLRSLKDAADHDKAGSKAEALLSTSLSVISAASFLHFGHGKSNTPGNGMEFTAYVNGDTPLDAAKFPPPAETPHLQ